MKKTEAKEPIRDQDISSFSEIMSDLANSCKGLHAAVFFDSEGETVDYFSYLDPFATRLAAAHHGVLFESTRARLGWLGAGSLKMMEIFTDEVYTVTVPVGEGYYLTTIAGAGSPASTLYEAIVKIAKQLRCEMGW